MFEKLEYIFRLDEYRNNMTVFIIWGIIFNTFNNYYYFVNFIRHRE